MITLLVVLIGMVAFCVAEYVGQAALERHIAQKHREE